LSARVAALVARSTTAIAVALALATAVLAALNGSDARLFSQQSEAGSVVLGIAAPLLGLIVVSRRPRQTVGWLLIGLGLSQAVSGSAGELATYALLTRPGVLPGAAFISWLQTWTWIPGFALAITVLPLVFPDGRLVSRRWRPAVYAATAALVLLLVTFATGAWPLRGPRLLETHPPTDGSLGLTILAGVVLMLGAGVAGVASLVVRLRRSAGVERPQVKWFLLGAFAFVLSQITGQLVPALLTVLNVLGSTSLLAGVAIALFRFRLYDIDRIISRTVSYALLTGVLVAIYVGLVTALTRLLPVSSSLGVALSTLAVAALLQPMRRRVQSAVDRRFNRARYDAARTIEAFSTRLREQVYLDSVNQDLLAVVRETVQPASASTWLRS